MARFIASVSRLGVMPGRQTFSGLRWMVVSSMLNGAGRVGRRVYADEGREERPVGLVRAADPAEHLLLPELRGPRREALVRRQRPRFTKSNPEREPRRGASCFVARPPSDVRAT